MHSQFTDSDILEFSIDKAKLTLLSHAVHDIDTGK